MDEEEKKCLECGELIEGRVDKKYCSDHCRNAYNNHIHSQKNNEVRNVNRVLRNNKRILDKLNPGGKARATREKLLGQGFKFNYITSYYRTKKGDIYFYCYDQGYIETGKGFYSLVRKEEYID